MREALEHILDLVAAVRRSSRVDVQRTIEKIAITAEIGLREGRSEQRQRPIEDFAGASTHTFLDPQQE